MRINDYPDHQNHRKKTTNNVAKKRTARDKSRSGFTLAEMLITVAIIGILAAFGFVAVIRYQKSLKQTELDDTARQIFVAAQNHMTVSRASGNWDTYVAEAEGQKGGGTDKLGAAMGAGAGDPNGPSDYDENSLGSWNSSWANVTSAKDQEHDFRYVTVSADDTNNPGILSMILPYNAIDETLRGNGNIVIEYDAKTAAVYGVWYCKMADLKKAMSTNTTGTASSSVISSIANTESYKNDNRVNKSNRMKSDPMVGYYGGATAAKREGEKQDTLSAIIENDDRLMLQVAVPDKDKSGSGSDQRTYTVKAVITGQTSKHSREITLGTSNALPASQKNTNSLNGVYKDSSSGYRLYYYTLDSVTDGADAHFASQFCNASGNPEEQLLPGENLTITVSLSYDGEASRKGSSSNGSLSSKGSASNDASSVTLTANSLFANGSANDDQTAGIVYGRHLQNLSTVVSGVNREASGSTGSAGTGSNSGGSGAVITKAKMMRDLDWSKMTIRFLDSNPIPRTSAGASAGSSGSSAQNYAVSSYNSEWNTSDSGSVSSVSKPAGKAVTAAGKFYSISDSALTAFNGNGYVISNLQIGASKTLSSGSSAGDSVTYAGLFGYVDSGIAEDSHSAGGNASGSPAGNSMTVSLLTLKNPTAENATFAGFVIGKTDRKTSVQNVTITSDQALSIAADQAAGGILGEAESTYTNIQYAKVLAGTRLTVRANNNNFSTAGGILGGQIGAKTGTEGTGTGLSIENCTVSVSGAENSSSNTNNAENNGSAGAAGNSDKSVQVSGRYSAGGILGYCGASEADNTGGNSAGSSAGNSVYNGAVNIQNCSAIGAGNEDLVSARKAAAGLAGYISAGGKVDIENNAASVYVAGSDSQNPSGTAGFGGFIGYLNSTNNDSRVSNCYVGGRTAGGEYKYTVNDNTMQGRYNICGYGYVGGFIGQIAGSNSLTINKCFTTASAYSGTTANSGNGSDAENAAEAGSFIANSTNANLSVTSCYSTGLTNGTVFVGGSVVNNSQNYYLAGVNKSDLTGAGVKKANVNDAGTPFAEQTSPVNTNRYDSSLKGKYPYQMISGQSVYYGDWVVPKAQDLDGSFGILYYEIVQHGTGSEAAKNKSVYYHGYIGNAVVGGNASNGSYKEINTRTTIDEKKSPGKLDHGLLMSENGGDYVTEDGYILLVSNKIESDNVKISWDVDGYYNAKTVSDLCRQNILVPYKNITGKLNIEGYNAYYFNASLQAVIGRLKWYANDPTLNIAFYLNQFSEVHFHIIPYFADYVSTSADAKSYTIRSAHQLNLLFNKDLAGGRFIGNNGEYTGDFGSGVVTQTMDISYDNTIKYTYLGSTISYSSPKLEDLVGTYQGEKTTNGRYYKLDHLTQCLVNKIFATGKLMQLDITNMSADSVVNENAGELKKLTVSDSKFQKSALVSTNNPGNTGNISDCSLYGVSMRENGIAGDNHGTISNVKVERADITGNGLVTNNQGGNGQTSKIENCIITDSKIGQDGIVKENHGSISYVNIQEAMISGNGFVSTNGWGLAQTITNCKIVNAQIGKNGFCETNSGTITNCQVYADNSLYESYLQKYNGGTGYYHPNDNTIDSSLSEDRKRSEGYNLMVCGVVPDAELTNTNINDSTSGFVNTNTGNISNCSYSGKVYGGSQAAGFFCKATKTIDNCYANVLVSANNQVSGFGIATDYDASISNCHSVGMTLTAEKGAGFLLDSKGATLFYDYSAIWNNTTKDYSLFVYDKSYNKGITGCGYLSSMDGITNPNPQEIQGVTGYSHAKLSENTSLGTKAKETVPYNQYTTDSQYPYPMPADMTAYGDWSKSSGYSIYFDSNGGSGTMAPMTGLQYIESYNLRKNAFTNDGYVFDGWKDKKNNKIYSDEEKIRALSQKDRVTLYAIWKKIENSVDYSYTGSVKEYTAPADGWYKLEVWGADGGDATFDTTNNAKGGTGGYTVNYVYLTQNQNIDVYVGGRGQDASISNLATDVKSQPLSGGWNGGGNAYSYSKIETKKAVHYWLFGSGGGASHMALNLKSEEIPATLSDYSGNSDSVLLVAGGGGGAGLYVNKFRTMVNWKANLGGYGGGQQGGSGKAESNTNDGKTYEFYLGTGGNQTQGGTVDYNQFGSGRFGLGGSPFIDENENQNCVPGAGGGGGWYGGGSSNFASDKDQVAPSAGGGSGYFKTYDITSPITDGTTMKGSTLAGGNAAIPSFDSSDKGNGHGRITYLPSYSFSITINNVEQKPVENNTITISKNTSVQLSLKDAQNQYVNDATWKVTDQNGNVISGDSVLLPETGSVRTFTSSSAGTYVITAAGPDEVVSTSVTIIVKEDDGSNTITGNAAPNAGSGKNSGPAANSNAAANTGGNTDSTTGGGTSAGSQKGSGSSLDSSGSADESSSKKVDEDGPDESIVSSSSS